MAAEGESSAFGVLYDRYQPAIYRFIYLKVGHREEAEDLTHHVFTSAWENIASFTDRGFPITSWFYRIARNRVTDYYRTRKISISVDEIPEDIGILAQEDHTRATAEKMDLELIRRALETLSQEHQDIVIMRFVEELSHKEVAAATGKSEGSIRVLQHRALKALKEAVEKEIAS